MSWFGQEHPKRGTPIKPQMFATID